jgi:SpoVK/Ycf46/Vps4 family AAA+-type ATPase
VRRPEATFTWDDIVLPEPVLSQLQSISSHVRHASDVLEDWNYRSRMPYGHGVTALFSGASGTGKTMAAQILAADLNVELFQVDLAKTVSKYIGETEKNLDIVFDAAEKASAVLLFDEADALFGKRTEVRDAHDRYANVEVAYLLQRMEAYSGLAVLTTNFRQNLDTAFMRRLRFVIDFPAPNAKEREGIWERVFPPGAPLAEDVSFSFLARRLELTGGNIQQIALRAAFAAVADSKAIEMRHIVQAACEELHKLGMNNAEQSLAELAVCA